MNRKIQVRFLEGKGGVIRPTYSIKDTIICTNGNKYVGEYKEDFNSEQ